MHGLEILFKEEGRNLWVEIGRGRKKIKLGEMGRVFGNIKARNGLVGWEENQA